jgi:hypothetical protein
VKIELKTDIICEIYCILKFKIRIHIDCMWAMAKEVVGCTVVGHYYCSAAGRDRGFLYLILLKEKSSLVRSINSECFILLFYHVSIFRSSIGVRVYF